MSVLRRVKLRTPDGTESIEYPLGVEAKNVEVANQENLSQRLVRIDEDLEKNEEDIAAVGELAGTNKQNIGANEIRIDALERRSASVDKKPYYFDTVADMKAYQGLKVGDMAITLGYYETNDGGNGNYKIREKTDTDVIDNGSLIEINNNLVVELIETNPNAKQFGCYGNNINDDTEQLNNYITYCNTNNKNIIIPYGEYKISNNLTTINAGLSVIGEFESNGVFGKKTTIFDNRINTTNYLITFQSVSTEGNLGSYIKNIRFHANNQYNLNCINMNTSGYCGLIENLTFEFYAICINYYRVNAIITRNCNIYACGSNIANSLNYAICITGCVDITFDNVLIEHTRFIVLDNTKNIIGHSHKFINCYFEMSTNNLVGGYEPINCQSGKYGGTTFTECTFVNLSAKTIASILNIELNNVFYMIYIQNGIISNCKFMCGGGSGQWATSITNQSRFLGAINCLISNNIFLNTLYLLRGILLNNSNFINNNIEINIETDDYSNLSNKFIIQNDSSICENNRMNIKIQDNSNLSSLPRLFKFYKKYYLESSTPSVNEKYNFKNFYEYGTQSNLATFLVTNYNQTLYTVIDLKIKRSNDATLVFNGKLFINFASNSITVIEQYEKSFSALNDIILSKVTNNQLAIQIQASNQQLLTVEIDGLDNQAVNIYLDPSITTQIESDTSISLKNI